MVNLSCFQLTMNEEEFDRLVVENARLKATLKASDYERQKLVHLVKNLMQLRFQTPAEQDRMSSGENQEFQPVDIDFTNIKEEAAEFEKQFKEMNLGGDQEEEDLEAHDPAEEERLKVERLQAVYGQDWERVRKAETRLESNFLKFCDKNNPKLWPCIPLNLKYK